MRKLIRSVGSFKILLAICDVLLLMGVAAAILLLRAQFSDYSVLLNEALFFGISSIIAVPVFREVHLYRHKVFTAVTDQIIALGSGMLWVGILQVCAVFLIKDSEILDYSRGHVVLYVVGGWAVLSLFRIAALRRRRHRLTSGHGILRRILVVGAGSLGQNLAMRIFDNPGLGLKIVAFVDDDPQKIGRQLLGRKVIGPLERIAEIIAQHKADEIYIAINSVEYSRLLEIIEQCRRTGLPVTVTANHFRIIHDKIGTSEFSLISSLTLRPGRTRSMAWMVKNILDRVGAALLLFLLAPVLAAIALAVKFSSPGPVLYRSSVVGRNGRLFTWYKFRTMRIDGGENLHREHLKKVIQENGSTEKLKDDPRITSVGGVLRKYSLDELPQLVNVLRGEMSLIGPRPCREYEYEHFDEWHKRRFSVKPGITGLWQVTGRNKSDVTFNDSIILDLYYIQNFSLRLDLRILLKTIPVVLFGRGGV